MHQDSHRRPERLQPGHQSASGDSRPGHGALRSRLKKHNIEVIEDDAIIGLDRFYIMTPSATAWSS
jgi:hypothetical protein